MATKLLPTLLAAVVLVVFSAELATAQLPFPLGRPGGSSGGGGEASGGASGSGSGNGGGSAAGEGSGSGEGSGDLQTFLANLTPVFYYFSQAAMSLLSNDGNLTKNIRSLEDALRDLLKNPQVTRMIGSLSEYLQQAMSSDWFNNAMNSVTKMLTRTMQNLPNGLVNNMVNGGSTEGGSQ